MRENTEAERVQRVYSARDVQKRALYRWDAPDIQAAIFSIDLAFSKVLVNHGYKDLSSLKILDVGCGKGRWLRVLNEWGADFENLFGTEINVERIKECRATSNRISVERVSGSDLPYENSSFDFVSSKTVFSSILDRNLRTRLASEIVRVCKDGGLIAIFDFRISSPKNTDTIGISKYEIKRLFPDKRLVTKAVMLAPPLHRKISAFSPHLAVFAEWLFPFLRTHCIYVLSDY